MTLGDAKVGSTVVVTKIEGDSIQAPYYGHGHYKRKRAVYQKGSSTWRSCRDYSKRL